MPLNSPRDREQKQHENDPEAYYSRETVDRMISAKDATIDTLRERLARYFDPISQLGPNSHLRLWATVGQLMEEKDIVIIGRYQVTGMQSTDFRVTLRNGMIHHGPSLTEALEKSGAIIFECESLECKFQDQPDGRQIREQKTHVMQGGRHYHLTCVPPPG